MATTKPGPFFAPYCESYFALQSKCTKKYLSLPRGHSARQLINGFFPGYLRCIQYYLLERRKVFKIAFAAGRRDAAEGLGAIAIMPLHDLHDLLPLQHAQMPAEVAVGERTQLLEIAEGQSLGIANQRGEHTEPCPLVNHPVQSFISEGRFALRRFSFHRCPPAR